MTRPYRQAKAMLLLAALSVGLLILASGPNATLAGFPQAKQEQVDEKTIRDLIQQLGADSFDAREEATKRLAAIGDGAFGLLEKAAKDSPDAEIRQRAGQLVQTIGSTSFVVVDTFKPKTDLGTRITRLALLPNGQQIVVSSIGPPFVWDYTTQKTLPPVNGDKNYTCFALGVSADGQRIILGLMGNRGQVFDLKTGKVVKQLTGHSAAVRGAALLGDNKTALTASLDKTIRVWDLKTGKELRRFEDVTDAVTCLTMSADGKTVATGHLGEPKNKATVRLWDLEMGSEIRPMEGHKAEITALAFSPDGKSLLSASYDRTLRLWDVATGNELKRFEGHSGGVECAAFTRDGKRLISGGDAKDSSLRLWDVQSGKQVVKSAPVGGAITGLAVLPDGRRCVTSGKDGLIRVWEWKK